jgi:hypothetical protein
MAWRAMSHLQKHLEANGAPIAPAARNVPKAEPAAPIIPHQLARIMERDGVVPADDDEGSLATEPGEVGN